MVIELGLASAKEGYRPDPSSDQMEYRTLEGQRVLYIHPPVKDNGGLGVPVGEMLLSITSGNGILQAHSNDKPLWVACPDHEMLEALLAEHYGCERGRPADLAESYLTLDGPPGSAAQDEPAPASASAATSSVSPEAPSTASPAEAADAAHVPTPTNPTGA